MICAVLQWSHASLECVHFCINTLALGARLPTMHEIREHVEASGLISYGPNWPDQRRRAADYINKILRGAKPADIPVEQLSAASSTANTVAGTAKHATKLAAEVA